MTIEEEEGKGLLGVRGGGETTPSVATGIACPYPSSFAPFRPFSERPPVMWSDPRFVINATKKQIWIDA